MVNFKKIKSFLKQNYPLLTANYRILHAKKSGCFHHGWGMYTTSINPPWEAGQEEVSTAFRAAYQKLINKVKNLEFNLTQFSDVFDQESMLDELRWRHYFVFWSAYLAAKRSKKNKLNIVECGVCDGLTAFLAMTAILNCNRNALSYCYLYDAWSGMLGNLLLDSELDREGDYAYLEVERTKSNLGDFETYTKFKVGYIPDVLFSSESPSELSWLHIDLNSALATKASLEFFFERITDGGVILFDDYAWLGYEATRTEIEKFLADKPGLLLPLPTGQSIFLKD